MATTPGSVLFLRRPRIGSDIRMSLSFRPFSWWISVVTTGSDIVGTSAGAGIGVATGSDIVGTGAGAAIGVTTIVGTGAGTD
jgi:hypothetical protein